MNNCTCQFVVVAKKSNTSALKHCITIWEKYRWSPHSDSCSGLHLTQFPTVLEVSNRYSALINARLHASL